MKKVFLTLLLVAGSFAIQAQELKWETDINKAIAVSNKTKKPMDNAKVFARKDTNSDGFLDLKEFKTKPAKKE